MLTTTLNLLRAHNACASRYAHLAAELGADYGDDTPIPLLRILDANGLDDALWALRACEPADERDRFARLLACDFAEHVLPIWQAKYPDDLRPAQCIEAARAFAVRRDPPPPGGEPVSVPPGQSR